MPCPLALKRRTRGGGGRVGDAAFERALPPRRREGRTKSLAAVLEARAHALERGLAIHELGGSIEDRQRPALDDFGPLLRCVLLADVRSRCHYPQSTKLRRGAHRPDLAWPISGPIATERLSRNDTSRTRGGRKCMRPFQERVTLGAPPLPTAPPRPREAGPGQGRRRLWQDTRRVGLAWDCLRGAETIPALEQGWRF